MPMKEHGIIYQGWGVRAILEGRKTHTRRVITPHNSYVDGGPWPKGWKFDWSTAYVDQGPSPAGNPGPYLHADLIGGDTTHRIYPRYSPGDLIWVRETWSPWADKLTKDVVGLKGEQCLYKADYLNGASSIDIGGDYHWHPSIHMPRWVSRITLEITDVPVERIQEISEKDARAEGCWLTPKGIGHYSIDPPEFDSVWNSINLKRGYGWDTNPWVWVIEFRRIKP